jgi:hypothetical protein
MKRPTTTIPASSASGIVLPLIGSVIASQWGIGLVGLLTVALMVPPAVMLLRLREVRPGTYELALDGVGVQPADSTTSRV